MKTVKPKPTHQLRTNSVHQSAICTQLEKPRMKKISPLFSIMKKAKRKLNLAFKTNRRDTAWVHRR